MTTRLRKIIDPFLVVVLCVGFAAMVTAQTAPPLLQDIKVQPAYSTPKPNDDLVKKTGSAMPAIPAATSSIRTLFPALAEVSMPGYSGMIVESLEGNVVAESNAGMLFNPASNVKIATSYAVLKTFGPDYRFLTNVYTDGAVDRNTGVLVGNIYVSGKDPVFGSEHAILIAAELNKLGIRSVTGDLIVTDNFAMNYSSSPNVSAQALFLSMDANRRIASASRAWTNYLTFSGKVGKVAGNPSVSFTGAAYVQPVPSNLTLLFTHESTPLREIVKATMCYSNNFLAERLGDMVGGPYAVSRLVQLNAGVPVNEFSLQTSSGLGYNRVTPNAMMKLLHVLRSDLKRYKMTFADIMPVAGVDKGTLENRFDSDFSTGSVVGKTGTLGQTDGGVSALAGEMNTRNGRYLFVIFNQKGSVARFRTFQNFFVSLVQGQFGGAAPLTYDPTPLEMRLAKSRISYPSARRNRGEE